MRRTQQNMCCRRLLLAAALVAMMVGCTGSQGPETVDVTGTVTLDGSPVEGANVTFHPIDSENALASQAVTDAAGRFKLTTHVAGGRYKDGIVPGNYAVVVNKLDTAAIKSTLAPPKNLLPIRYNDMATSGLSAKVLAGQENDIPLALQAN